MRKRIMRTIFGKKKRSDTVSDFLNKQKIGTGYELYVEIQRDSISS